jgi:ZIP family zinc transporter
MALIATIDKLVPEPENPHDAFLQQDAKGPPCKSGEDSRLLRLGMMTALTIGIHNFPEGMATFVAAMSDPARGASVALAIAIHNIPEGIVVAIPVYYATGNKRKALFHSFLSGASEPIGAVVGYALAYFLLPKHAMGMIEAAVAGVMVFISLDQLIPNAHAYGKSHLPMYGLLGGMAVMAVTLLMVH